MQQLFADPQVAAREMLVRMPHPTAGEVTLVGSPLKLSRTPVKYERHPPLVGEHTGEILRELGYTAEQVVDLQKEGIV